MSIPVGTPIGTPIVTVDAPKLYPEAQCSAAADTYLDSLGLPRGLADSFKASMQCMPLRIFVVDNSGSMATTDGHRLQGGGGQEKFVTCSRWEELSDSLRWHAALAARTGAQTEVVLAGAGDPDAEIAAMERVITSGPTGRTPLCEQLRAAVARVEAMAPALRASGGRACLVIASDGAATDGDVAAAMRPLQSLPVWVVVRLCTDDASVVEYWNKVDGELELDMDVLDDHAGEAVEVCRANPWLTYGLALHRLREFGCMDKVVDLLDERRLSASEALGVVRLVLGGVAAEVPDPQIDWARFEAALTALLANEAKAWDPLRSTPRPWLSVNKLRRQYGQRGAGHVLRDAVLDTKHVIAGDPTRRGESGCVLQ